MSCGANFCSAGPGAVSGFEGVDSIFRSPAIGHPNAAHVLAHTDALVLRFPEPRIVQFSHEVGENFGMKLSNHSCRVGQGAAGIHS